MRYAAVLTLVGVALLGGPAGAAAQMPESGVLALAPGDIKWTDGPLGTKVTYLYGRPSEPGVFIARVTVPPHTRLMPHWHPVEEIVTVVSGTVYFGIGETFDTAREAVSGGELRGSVTEGSALWLDHRRRGRRPGAGGRPLHNELRQSRR